MTSTNVDPASTSAGEITEVQEAGGAVRSDNPDTNSGQFRTPAEEQAWLSDCVDTLFTVTEFSTKIGDGGEATIWGFNFEGTPLVLRVYKEISNVPKWDDKVFNIIAPHVCSSVGYTKVHDGMESVASIMPRHLMDLRKLINSKMTKGSSGEPFLYVTAVDLIVQLAIGMSNLHKRGIMHRAIKAENLLVTHVAPNEKIYCIAVADFDDCKSDIGTGFWRAPEILEAVSGDVMPHEVPFTYACDVYSFAVTCSEILTGSLPFPGELWSECDGVLSGKRPELPAGLPEEMASLIHRCWHEDPEKRPTSIEILQALREIVQERTELNPVQTRFDLADPWSDDHKDTSEQPSRDELLQSLRDELEVLAQQNETLAVRTGNEFIELYEDYKSKFDLANVWHLHRFWGKLKVALPMINKGNEFINSLPDHGSNTVKTSAIFSRLVKPLVQVDGLGSIFQAYARKFSGQLLQRLRNSKIPVEEITRSVSELLRGILKSMWASKLACQVRLVRTTVVHALRTCFKFPSRQSYELVDVPIDNTTLVSASCKTS